MNSLRLTPLLLATMLTACGDGSVGQYPETASNGASSSGGPDTPDDASTSTSTAANAESSTSNDATSNSDTGSDAIDACGDAPAPHICAPSGSPCLCPIAELGPFGGLLATGDVDGDGDIDLAYMNADAEVALRRSDGDTLGVATTVHEASARLISGGSSGVAFFENQGTPRVGRVAEGSFVDITEVGGNFATSPGDLGAGDFDGNGEIDVLSVTANGTSATATVVLNVGETSEESTFEIEPTLELAPVTIHLIEDLDGDGTSDTIVASLYGSPRVAFGGPSGLGPFAEIDAPIADLSLVQPFDDPETGERRFLQAASCSDCTPAFGAYSVFRQSESGSLELLGSVSGDAKRSGGRIHPMSTSAGTFAVSLGSTGVVVVGTPVCPVEFRPFDAFDAAVEPSVHEGFDAFARATIPISGDDHLLAEITTESSDPVLTLFSLEVTQ